MYPKEIEIVITPEMANEEGVNFLRPSDCPVARYLRQKLSIDRKNIAVGPYKIYIDENRGTEEAKTFIYEMTPAFDAKEFHNCEAGSTFKTIARLQHDAEPYTD